jgi:hypothetical protein
MDAQVVSIFDPILRKVRKELQNGPLSISYLCSKYGVAALLQIVQLTGDLEVAEQDHEQVVQLRNSEIDNNGTK